MGILRIVRGRRNITAAILKYQMPQLLDGPRIEPKGTATALVVVLHGYGANGEDLMALGDGWRRWLPEAVFVSPNAPETIPGMPGALQWFPLTFRDASERWRGVVAARPALDRFLDTEVARYCLAADRLVLAGFSQGTMLALHVGLRREATPAAATRVCWLAPSAWPKSSRGRRSC